MAIEEGWLPPTIMNEYKMEVLKSKNNWSHDEAKATSGNAKAINPIFGEVDENQFT